MVNGVIASELTLSLIIPRSTVVHEILVVENRDVIMSKLSPNPNPNPSPNHNHTPTPNCELELNCENRIFSQDLG